MKHMLPALRLTSMQVLRDGALRRDDIAIANSRICTHARLEVDLTGYPVLPGIVDMQGDAFERHAIDHVVFNDHLPGALQIVKLAPHRLASWAERDGGKSRISSLVCLTPGPAPAARAIHK